MKYIYQDLIEEEILKHKDIDVDENTLKNAEFVIHNISFGLLDIESGAIEPVHMAICSGEAFGVFDKSHNCLKTEFTLFDIDYHSEHFFGCNVKIE